MTRTLEEAVKRARALPSHMQEDIARFIDLYLSADPMPYEMSPEEEASMQPAFDQIDRRELATPEQVQAVLAKHDL